MAETAVTIEVDGTPLGADDALRVTEIELDEATWSGDAAALTAQLVPDDSGAWRSVLDPLTAPKTPVAVELSRNGSSYRFDGLSTEASWSIAPDGASSLTVKAIDRTLEMNVEEKVTSWSGTPDSAIADSIISSYGHTPDVESTPDTPDPEVHVVIQRATDWAFLRSLAAKWGYAVYLEAQPGGVVVGSFKPLDPLAAPQATLSLGFGADARSATVQAQLLAGADVSASRVATLSTQVLQGTDDGTAAAQGSESLGGQTTVLLAPTDVDGEIDPTSTTKAVATRSAFGVRLEAAIDTEQVDTILRARRPIDVEGLGDALSGTYLVDSVRHRLDAGGHAQSVTLLRNALGGGGAL